MRLLAAVTVGLFVWASMEALAGRTLNLKRTGSRRRRAARQVWLSQAGAEYDNVKVVYLSPQIFGVELGVQLRVLG